MVFINSQESSTQLNSSTIVGQRKMEPELNAQRSSSKGPCIMEITSSNIVGDLMWPIILFLRLSGHSSLAYQLPKAKVRPSNLTTLKVKPRISTALSSNSNKHYDNEAEIETLLPLRTYEIRFKSMTFAWSVLCALWILFSWINFVQSFLTHLEVGFGPRNGTSAHHGGRGNKVETGAGSFESFDLERQQLESEHNTITVTIMTAMGVVLALIQAFELVLAWTESPSLARFLNDWASLQAEFKTTFPCSSLMGPRYDKMKRARDLLLLFYVAIPTVFFVSAYLFANVNRGDRRVSSNFFEYIKIFPFAWHLSAVSLMEDVKVIMINLILAEAFAKIREGILNSASREVLTAEKIKAWRRLIFSVRRQVSHAGEAQKAHQLLLIAGSIFQITSSVFMLLHSPWDGKKSWLVLVSGLGFLFLQMGRLYLKIIAADLITKEEIQIAEEFILMDLVENVVGIQLEAMFFHDLIMEKPSVISFGNYVQLNKKLLLGVASQVVTYLIVLMQFTN